MVLSKVETIYANQSNILNMKMDMEEYDKNVEFLENQVEYYKAKKGITIEFINYALDIQDELDMVQRPLCSRHTRWLGHDTKDTV